MKEKTIVIIVTVVLLVIVAGGIYLNIWANKKIQLPNGITIRNVDYIAMKEKFGNYMYIKVWDMETGKLDVLTNMEAPRINTTIQTKNQICKQ